MDKMQNLYCTSTCEPVPFVLGRNTLTHQGILSVLIDCHIYAYMSDLAL